MHSGFLSARSCLIALALLVSVPSLRAGDATTNAPAAPTPPPVIGTPATPPTDKTKFEIFLLVGQSNMAGRAPITDADRAADPHVFVLNHLDKWYSQGEPIHFDSPGRTGVGPAFAFAKLLAAKTPGVTIGLVPCAYGGTALKKWEPASKDTHYYPPDNLYNNAIRRGKLAMQSGTLNGILWLQGENDANAKAAPVYAANLAKLVAQFRADLNAPKVPFIAAEVGYFDYTKFPDAKTINDQINTIPAVISDSATVSANGLKDKGDHLHFNNDSQKELGQRYLDSFLKLQRPAPAKP